MSNRVVQIKTILFTDAAVGDKQANEFVVKLLKNDSDCEPWFQTTDANRIVIIYTVKVK